MLDSTHSLATKKDYLIVSIIGILFGLLLIPILENIKPAFWFFTLTNSLILMLGFLFFSNIALWIGSLFGAMLSAFWQFTKFAAVGSLNGVLDFGILNFLSFIFQIYSGPFLALFNAISVAVATTNSYLMNKFWSFQSREPIKIREFSKFLVISAATISINTLVVYLLTTHIEIPGALTKEVWENIAKLAAVPVTMIFNFVGYKYLVFKGHQLNV